MTVFTANTYESILNSTVSISDLTRAGAKKVFDTLDKDETKIILKNNKPIGALLSSERLQELLEKEEDLYLMKLAIERDANAQKYISKEDFFEEFGIHEDALDNLPELEME